MNIPESSHGHWTSARAFLCVTTGTALGIGGVSRLPELMTRFGGLAFLCAYLAALLLLALPLLLGEWVLGRWIRSDLMSGFRSLSASVAAPRLWYWTGGVILAAGVMLLSYYSVVAGWSLGFVFRGASGALAGDAEHARATFLALAQDPERSLAWHTLFMVFACMIVSVGVREGIERAARYLVPGAFFLMMILTIAATRWGNTPAALAQLFAWRGMDLGWNGAIEAVLQAFFTLGLGFGAMAALGTYLPADAPLLRLGLAVVALDTAFSLMAAVFLLALAAAAGQTPAPGLGLLFQTLPASLPEGMRGVLLATGFYLVLFSITMAAAPTLLEPLTRQLMEQRRLTRVFAATTAGMLVWYLGIGSVISLSSLPEVRWLGRNFFDWLQLLAGLVFAPAGALLICTLLTRIMPPNMARSAFGAHGAWVITPWLLILRDAVRLGLLTVVIYASGVLHWLAELWG